MTNVVDARQTILLKTLRDTGDWQKACNTSGIFPGEFEKMCFDNKAFDLAQVEALLEYLEETLQSQANHEVASQMQDATLIAKRAHYTRHPDG